MERTPDGSARQAPCPDQRALRSSSAGLDSEVSPADSLQTHVHSAARRHGDSTPEVLWLGRSVLRRRPPAPDAALPPRSLHHHQEQDPREASQPLCCSQSQTSATTTLAMGGEMFLLLQAQAQCVLVLLLV
ncbi:hypothetical protein ZWY2020_012612 [Hordeum vulgare]|nr:hypothetical protein ZWY2020_012612 [Hordeum vulgare]